MPTTITKEYTLYQYNELSETAKAQARKWYTHNDEHIPNDWYENEYDYFQDNTLTELGIIDSEFSFSGFYNQGDGAAIKKASFDLKLLLPKLFGDNTTKINRLIKLYENDAFVVNIKPETRNGGNYISGNINIESYSNHKHINALIDEFETLLTPFIEVINRKLYKALEAGYDSYQDESNIAENIIANEYTFLESGDHFS